MIVIQILDTKSKMVEKIENCRPGVTYNSHFIHYAMLLVRVRCLYLVSDPTPAFMKISVQDLYVVRKAG